MARQRPAPIVDTELLLAIGRGGSKEEIQSLLALGASPSFQSGSGDTPLLASVKKKNYAAFDILLPISNPSIRDCGSLQAIDVAALMGLDRFVQRLIAAGGSQLLMSEMDQPRWTPLMHAATSSHLKCVELLLPVSSVFDETSDGSSAFTATLSTVSSQGPTVAKMLFDAQPSLALATGPDGETPLFKAIRCNAASIAEILIPLSDLSAIIKGQAILDCAKIRAPHIAAAIQSALDSREIAAAAQPGRLHSRSHSL